MGVKNGRLYALLWAFAPGDHFDVVCPIIIATFYRNRTKSLENAGNPWKSMEIHLLLGINIKVRLQKHFHRVRECGAYYGREKFPILKNKKKVWEGGMEVWYLIVYSCKTT